MSKQNMNIIGILLAASLLVLLASCGPPEGQAVQPSSNNTTQPPPSSGNVTEPPRIEGVTLPPGIPQPEPGNPKLDPLLSQLIEAEKKGEAEALARQRNLDLVDGKVRVGILAMPGQLDVAANVTAKYGTVEIIARDLNVVGALVPITSLTALAGEESVSSIQIPVKPMPTN